jgi:hypothetical protein
MRQPARVLRHVDCDVDRARAAMRGYPMKLGLRETIVSPAIFAGMLLMLVSFDDRVRERFTDLVGGGVGPWGDRLADFGNALADAARYQSIENAPLLIFSVVGAVLVLFMFRT